MAFPFKLAPAEWPFRFNIYNCYNFFDHLEVLSYLLSAREWWRLISTAVKTFSYI